jgi:Putative adhesin
MIATPGRITVLAIGLPLVLALGIAGAFDTAGTLTQTSERHSVSYAWRGGSLSVSSGSGDVRIHSGTGNQVLVSYTEHYNLRKPTVSATVNAGGVQLTTHCPGGLFGNNCAVNYDITVPRSAVLAINSGDGELDVNDMAAPMSLQSGDGRISLVDVSGDVVARSGDGEISGTGLASPNLDVTAGDGAVDLAWSVRPRTVAARTGDASVTITVPRDNDPYRVSTAAGDGSVHVSVANSPTASDTIAVHTGDGAITIGYASD